MKKIKILSISVLLLILFCGFSLSVQADEQGTITVNPYKENIFGGKKTIRDGVEVWAINEESGVRTDGFLYNGQYAISIPLNEGASLRFTVYASYNQMTESESGIIVSSENPYPDTVELEFNGGPISKLIKMPIIRSIMNIINSIF